KGRRLRTFSEENTNSSKVTSATSSSEAKAFAATSVIFATNTTFIPGKVSTRVPPKAAMRADKLFGKPSPLNSTRYWPLESGIAGRRDVDAIAHSFQVSRAILYTNYKGFGPYHVFVRICAQGWQVYIRTLSRYQPKFVPKQ